MASSLFGLAALTLILAPRALGAVNPDESVYGYSFYGCISDSTSSPTLSFEPYFNQQMTMDLCVAYCAGHGNYMYVGVEYGYSVCTIHTV